MDDANGQGKIFPRTGENAAPPASEEDILRLIDAIFPSRTPHIPVGRGHDCAELEGIGGPLALSTDMFWQDTHFRTAYFTPREAGAKALASAASDLAAAGAVPVGFSLGLLLPPKIAVSTLEEMLAGMAEKAQEYGMALTGGDLARGGVIGFSLTVFGRPVEPGAPFLRRRQPQPGDLLFLVGASGLARVGLWALERHGRSAKQRWPAACAAHLAPRPCLAEGQALARVARDIAAAQGERESRIALMDVSDGPARDLPRLLNGLGADLDFSSSLVSGEVKEAAPHIGRSPEEIFLLGGEDYALLGSCPEELMPSIVKAVPRAGFLGRVRPGTGLFRAGKKLALHGFDHFSPAGDDASSALPPKTRPAISFQDTPIHWGTAPKPAAWHIAPGGNSAQCSATAVRNAAGRIIAACREAWQAGLMAGFNGNASCRIPSDELPCPEDGTLARRRGEDDLCESETPDAHGDAEACRVCLITRSGAAKNRLQPDDFAILTLPDGSRLYGPPPSSESRMHTDIYALCPQSLAVLHTHPPCLLALSLTLEAKERLLLPLPEAAAYRARIAWTPFHPPGSPELARSVAEAAQTHAAVWMERHGLVTHGPDLCFALSLTEELEQLAKVHLALLGLRPHPNSRPDAP